MWREVSSTKFMYFVIIRACIYKFHVIKANENSWENSWKDSFTVDFAGRVVHLSRAKQRNYSIYSRLLRVEPLLMRNVTARIDRSSTIVYASHASIRTQITKIIHLELVN